MEPTCYINTLSVSFASFLLYHIPAVSPSLLEDLDLEQVMHARGLYTHTHTSDMKRGSHVEDIMTSGT